MSESTTNALPTIWPSLEQLDKHSQEMHYLLGRWGCRYVKPVVDTAEVPHPRKAAGDALDEIDGMLTTLHQLRSALIDETRRYDDESNRRTDELLAKLRAERGEPAVQNRTPQTSVEFLTTSNPGQLSETGHQGGERDE